MSLTYIIMYLHITVFISFFGLTHTQNLDVGHIFIGTYNSSTGSQVLTDSYSFSFTDKVGKTLPVFALVYRDDKPSQIVPKTENITINCNVSASSSGYSGVSTSPATLNTDTNVTIIPLTLTSSGRPVTVKCFGQSLSATCPVKAGGAQFCSNTSVSNSVSVMILPPGSVSICESLITIKNFGSAYDCGFSVRLSERATSNVVVTCTQNGGSGLTLTVQSLNIASGSIDGQMTCSVQSGTAGSDASVTCNAQSLTGSQFESSNTVSTSTARFVLETESTMRFQSVWSEVYNSTFTSTLYLTEPLASGSVFVSCQAALAASLAEAESTVNSPNCIFTPSASTTTASTTTVTTTTSTTTVTPNSVATSNITTATPPTTPGPTTPPDPTSPWIVSNSNFTFTSSSSGKPGSVIKAITTERQRQPIDVRTEIIVTMCCVQSSNTTGNYLNKKAVTVAVAHLAPFVCSQCSNASITNPQNERVLQNPGFVEVAPCTCDLTQNACDIHCCCDKDCSNNERLRFNGCIPGLPGGQAPEPKEYRCSSNAFNQPDWQMLTCVYWENNWFLGMFYKNQQKLKNTDEISAAVNKKSKGKFSFSENERIFDLNTGQGYTFGSNLATIREDLATSSTVRFGTLALSQQGPGATCNPLGPVRYLMNQASSCRTFVTREQCSSLSVLSARIYAVSSSVIGCSQSFKVRKTLSGSEVTPTDVRYYCDTSEAPYIPTVTQALDSLDPTKSSNFPTDLSNLDCCDNCTNPECWQYNSNRSTDAVADLPPPCAWDSAYTSPLVPVINNNICENVVVDVRYNFKWSGSQITKLSAVIILANIGLTTTAKEIIQKFSVNWSGSSRISNQSDNFAASTDKYQRSGSAGYDLGKPLISGRRLLNVTTGQFGSVDTISAKQMAIWRPGVNGLCADALRQPLTFGDDSLSSCALRLTFNDLNNTCDSLRKLITNHLNVLMGANVIGRYGYNDVNNQSMWIPVIRQQTNISNTQDTVNLTDVTNTTQDMMSSWANSITGICLLPSAVNLQVLYAQTGVVKGSRIYEVLGAYINYTVTNWTMDCAGANSRRCDAASTYTQNFFLGSSVTFTQIPPRPVSTSKFHTRCNPDDLSEDSCYRYFNDFVREECYSDTCWQELAYPLMPAYIKDAVMYSLPFFLVLVLGIVGYASVAKPGWS